MADMGYRDELTDLSHRIRWWAVVRQVQEKHFAVVDRGDSKEPPNVQNGVHLTLDMYKNGHPSDPEGYYVYEGDEVWNYQYEEFAWVDRSITMFGQSSLTTLKDLILALEDAPAELCADGNWWRTGKKVIRLEERDAKILGDLEFRNDILLKSGVHMLDGDTWSGQVANKYQTAFGEQGERWEEIVYNNFHLTECLVTSLEAHLAAYITARRNVIDACEDTRLALIGLFEDEMPLSDSLSIIGSVVSAALSMFPPTAVAGALVGAAFAVGSTLVAQAEEGKDFQPDAPKAADGIEISGSSVMGVLSSLQSALYKISRDIDHVEQTVGKQLTESYSVAVGTGGPIPRYLLTVEQGTPTLSVDNLGELKANRDDLANAATVVFPAAATRVLTAHGTVTAAGTGEGAFISETGSVSFAEPAWQALRDLVQDLTGLNGAMVELAGEVLLCYAAEIGDVDATSAANITQTYEDLSVTYTENKDNHREEE